MDNQDSNNNRNDQQKNNNGKFGSYWIYGILALFIIAFNIYSVSTAVSIKVDDAEFERLINSGDVERITVINKEKAYVYIKGDSSKLERHARLTKKTLLPGDKPHYEYNVPDNNFFLNEMKEYHDKFPLSNERRTNWTALIINWMLPFIVIIVIWVFIMRRIGGGAGGPGAQIFNIGKSKATLFDDNSKVKINFEDVAGLDEAKEEVMEVVDFLKNPKKYTSLGGKIPKGVLLVGPPGTGKTLLAKAVAGEAGVPFFSISGSDFVEMFVGVGASRVRDLFRNAREKAPCIVFIDEIDAIGRARGKGNFQGGNDERENTLNQLLVEMDGFSTDKGVILMAATNRHDILDSALMRPGRFDRVIGIDGPDLKGREQIFNVHMKNIKISPDVDSHILAELTPGFAGADIANACNEAALIAARRNKKAVDMDDFNYALDKLIGGLEKKNKFIAPEEKKIIAFHEAGHAICGWFLEHASPLVKVTIVPRGIGTLGYAQYLPKDEYITREEALLDRICMTLGGRAAEEVVFGKISTGAQSDLDQITRIAYSMVAVFGMNGKVGNVSFYGLSQEQFNRPYADETAKLIDEEVRKMIDIQYQRAIQLLKDRRKELDTLALTLLEKEVLVKSDLERLIGPRPYGPGGHEMPVVFDVSGEA